MFKIIKSTCNYTIVREVEVFTNHLSTAVEDVSITFGNGVWIAVIKYRGKTV